MKGEEKSKKKQGLDQNKKPLRKKMWTVWTQKYRFGMVNNMSNLSLIISIKFFLTKSIKRQWQQIQSLSFIF